MQSFVSVSICLARKEWKKARKQLWDLDIYAGISIQLTRFCCPSAISINQSCAPLRERLTQCSLPECSPSPSLTSVHHEKIQTISVCHCQNVGHEMTANKAARREISIVTPTWYFHWHFPAVKLQNIEHLTKTTSNPGDAKGTRLVLITLRVGCQKRDICLHSEVTFPLYLSYRHSLLHKMLGRKHDETTSEESSVSLLNRLVRSELKKQMRELDLDSNIGFPVTCAYLHNTTHWTPGSNAWQRQQKSRNLYWHNVDHCHAWESDVRVEMSVFMLDSDPHCIFPFVILHNTNFRNM